MKTLWCWRCQQDVPMLDDAESAVVWRLYDECIRATKRERETKGVGLSTSLVVAMFEPVRKAYERLTGVANCHQDAVMHHRLSLYGPPCASCGKPLRTPRARHCAACGAERESALRERPKPQ